MATVVGPVPDLFSVPPLVMRLEAAEAGANQEALAEKVAVAAAKVPVKATVAPRILRGMDVLKKPAAAIWPAANQIEPAEPVNAAAAVMEKSPAKRREPAERAAGPDQAPPPVALRMPPAMVAVPDWMSGPVMERMPPRLRMSVPVFVNAAKERRP